jgi:hypothetical protein
LWNKPRLCVFVGEDHLAICRVSGRWRARVLEKHGVPLVAGEGAVAATLDDWLAAHPVAPGTQIGIVLGLPHVRYLLLPWSEELAQASFRGVLTRALFARQFQQEFSTQDVRYGIVRYGQPLLAACIGQSLVMSLGAVAAKHKLQIDCVEPLLAAVCDRFQPQLRHFTGALLIAEANRALIIRHESGAMVDLQVRPAAADDIAALAQRLSTGAACKVFAPRQPALAGSLPAAWLEPGGHEGFSAASDGAYAYALCGVR